MKLSHIENLSGNPQWQERIVDANLFFHKNIKSFCEDEGHKVIYVYSDSYIMPVSITKRTIFKYASFLSEPFNYSHIGDDIAAYLKAVCDYVKDIFRVQWISETPGYALFPASPQNALSIPFGSHIVDLNQDQETLWSNVHSKHRNVIKKAEKEGVVIEKGTNDKLLQDYHKVDIETWERSNVVANGLDHLNKLVKELKENIVFYVAYKDDEPQAGAIFYYNQEICYYMHGSSRNHSFTGSSNLLHWTAMLDMKAAAVRKYSFVGARINEDPDSKYHGIQRFKERFGGELFVGRKFKVITSPVMYHLYVFLISIKQSIHNRRLSWFHDAIDDELPKWKDEK